MKQTRESAAFQRHLLNKEEEEEEVVEEVEEEEGEEEEWFDAKLTRQCPFHLSAPICSDSSGKG